MLVRKGRGVAGSVPADFAPAFLRFFLATIIANLVGFPSGFVRGETLTPPYFNLAEGRKIQATATCGEDTEGPETFCKLVGANADNDLNVNIIQGQFCDVCDPTRPDKMHPADFAVDGMETWWQSPPLSRGMKYNEVNLTIDFGQEFHVAYVYIRMGNSPRPGMWVLEKSADYGKTYTPWQYFSDSPDDCVTFFGRDSLQQITRDDSVVCTTEYSKIVPLEGGEIPISILNNRPSANHYFNSTVLQEWTRATNVRLRLLRTKNFLGHLMTLARQDPTVTRRYFYSIKDISIGGRCMCNGHADTCDIQNPEDNNILLCKCQHNTCGAKCDTCCPGFEQKKWQQSKVGHTFFCEPCNCFQHSSECAYDEEVDANRQSLDIHGRYEGGGVCQNCQHNTEGINCNKCQPTYYRPYNKHWNETDVCQPCSCNDFYSTGNCAEGSGQCECRKEFTPPRCDSCSFGYFGYPDCRPCHCFLNGTRGLQCEATLGQCPCLPNFGGHFCKECAPGYFNFPECSRCECDPEGAVSETCDQVSGNCTCKNNFGGKRCDQCQNGYFGYPDCKYCNCDLKGTVSDICSRDSGLCICKEGYGGERCDICLPGHFGFPDCQPCNCSKIGSHGLFCDAAGKCSCLVNYAGKTCDQCSPGYYQFPECLPCECDGYGSNGVSCDSVGVCECHHNFAGVHCSACKEGFYNYPQCEDCNCHPAGVVAGFAGCGSVPAGELCQCKERVEGRICDKCKPLFWNLNPNNPDGCEECRCNIPGVLGGLAVCDTESGQCVCKSLVVARGCTECVDGTYNLQEDNLFGCSDCDCDIGGSVNSACDKSSGQCFCQPRVTGRTCKEPLQAHYFPTLYQYQYEVEDGRTPANTLVRYANDDAVFPGYSWKGYAVFSLLQSKILQDIYIQKPSLYRMVLRFVNRNAETVVGAVKVTPDNPGDNEQEFQVQFRNTTAPAFVTVAGAAGNTPNLFVMNPGRWQVAIEVNKNLFLDYFVLLPEDFYLATLLNKKVEKPCTVDEKGLCREFNYLNVTNFPTTFGVAGYVQNGRIIEKIKEFFQDTKHLAQMNVGNRVPLLNLAQPNLSFNVSVSQPGRYVIVVNYVMPLGDQRTHKIEAQITSGRSFSGGNLVLYTCPFTTLCRQAITNADGGIGVFHVGAEGVNVELKSSNAEVGIHSVVAIPYEDWSLDYVKPKSVCIKKDGACIAASFRNPPETKKIRFDENSTSLYATTFTNSTYAILSPRFNATEVRGRVPSAGYYSFIVHYYQPDFQDFETSVSVHDGQTIDARLPLTYCPSPSGCRSVVTQPDGNVKFAISDNYTLTVKNPGNKTVYLEYVLVIPSDFYDRRYLEEEDVDRTGEFIATCGSNHFSVDTTQDGFCRDSVFSLTAGHNSGALPCQCDYDGSRSFECDKFGGQCDCKPNIIGRKCEACKTGFYGFPDCKPCNCPSTAYCQPSTGQCICPPHVTGERCDQCEPLTYGFDPIIGCEECKCDPLGVERSLQCDLLNGSCPCKQNIVGRRCDVCLAGHFSFPYCEYCECDTRGTTDEICDQSTAECFCKKNTIGPACEVCREGSFNLQESNPDGCTECFCFGKTSRCSSSRLIKVAQMDMRDWQIVAINTSIKLEVAPLNLTVLNLESDAVGVDFTDAIANTTTAYFSAPASYIGKKLTVYGGNLNYTIFYTIGNHGSAVAGPDVILAGRKTYLTYSNIEQPPPSQDFPTNVQMVENIFMLPTGVQAKRDQIMEVLEDLRGIYIRATYWSASITTRLFNVIQDEAGPYQFLSQDRNIAFANSVEECACPPNYRGLSCEECAPGYYRVETGPHGGYCVPCQCHGHASDCDVRTGVCFNCTHHTTGDHCEQCEVGYHGNALAGTSVDCLICACPLPIASNNFATGCDVSSDGDKISCDCEEGYFGARCQSCASGFYGNPEQPGDFCKTCQCSGNINPEDPRSCDTFSGECLKCLNNTFGKACAICAPGYFGDAVNLKDCQSCICDRPGTDHCDHATGECVCKPNVVGEKCDRCALEHYGFQSGDGCVPCECAEASDSNQCDDVSGQCRCKEGVAGRSCDRCAAGFWNYTVDGCVSCGCRSQYSLGFGCNAETGQCECLKGVIGEKCDQCPHRWVFEKESGCHQCDSCTHALLDTCDEISSLIDPVIIDFDSANSGYFTRRKLDNMRDQLKVLEPKFEEIDPYQTNLTPYIEDMETIEQDAKNLHRKTNYSLDNSETLKTNASGLQDRAEELKQELLEAEAESMRVISGIEQITFELNQEEGPEIESALTQGQEMLDLIKNYDLEGRRNLTDKETEKVENLWQNVSNFKVPVDNLDVQVSQIKGDLKEFNDKLDDLYNQTQYSLNKADEAQRIIDRSGKDRLKKKFEDIERQTGDSENNLVVSQRLNDNATRAQGDAQDKLDMLGGLLDQLITNNEEFKISLDHNEEGIEQVQVVRPSVQQHANNLTERVMSLDGLLSETRDLSGSAVKAANAYKDIVKAVDEAKRAAEAAETDADTAEEMLKDIVEVTFDADAGSARSLTEAFEAHRDTNYNLRPLLDGATERHHPVQRTHNTNDARLKEIAKILQNIKDSHSLDAAYREASATADTAKGEVETIDLTTNETFAKLPEETEQARNLPKDVDNIERNTLQTQKQLGTVNEKLPVIIRAIEELPEKQARLQRAADTINKSITQLSQQIALARDIANQVKVGVKFYPNTTLELRSPANIEELSTSTRISGYFRTKELDGLLWYLGNPVGTNLRRTKTDDYMALVVQNGYPVLKLEVGNGAEQVISKKPVSDNRWYQFIIDRTGHNAKLTIREELPGGVEDLTTEEKTLDGPYSIFNLDKNKSKLFVGSFPPNHELQKDVNVNSFEGEMEDLVIGETPVSLWNFNNAYAVHGAVERNQLVNLQPSTGSRFNGNGYAVLNARSYPFRAKSDIQFSFKTFATEGLLFLAGKDKTFVALELRNGKLLYQYNLGSGTKKWHTTQTYNDGKWHTVRAIRDGAQGKFMVDEENIGDKTPGIRGASLETIETINFGGTPVKHNFLDVTNTKFDGCIDNILIMGSPLDLRTNIKAYDVTPGCPVKFARIVSFDKTKPGYLAYDGLSVSNNFKINFKFKTQEGDGLIFYGTDNLRTANISLALKDGHLVLISQKIELVSTETFNDSEWHVVSVMHNDRELRVDFDDFGYRVTDSPPERLDILHGTLFIGGLPRRIILAPGTAGTDIPFRGCIGDLTLNGNVVNFANTTEKINEILGKCVLDEVIIEAVPGVHKEPTLPPLGPLDPIVTVSPDEVTGGPYDSYTRRPGGDGGIDYVPTDAYGNVVTWGTPTAPLPTTTPEVKEEPEVVEPEVVVGPEVRHPQPPPTRVESGQTHKPEVDFGPPGTPPPATPKPPPKDGCALPIVPATDEMSHAGMYRFGTQKESRMEFKNLRGKHKRHFQFSLELKTSSVEEAVVLYISDGNRHSDYVAVFLQGGHVIYTYRAGSEKVLLRSDVAVNDDQWHFVNVSREEKGAKLGVDDSSKVSEFEGGGGGGHLSKIDLKPPLYVGGLDKGDYNTVLANINTSAPFRGCVRNLNMNDKPLERPEQLGLIPCSEHVEGGSFFGGGGDTYVRLKERFRVGDDFNVKLDIRPRNNSGVLIAVHGRKDFFVLEMVAGVMRLTVENGRGPIIATFKPKNFYFCNGDWHNIQAVKSKNVVTLSIDNVFTDPSIGDHHATSTDTGSALFLGGHKFIRKARGMASRLPYVGCIKNVYINNEPADIAPAMAEGNVTVGFCPTI